MMKLAVKLINQGEEEKTDKNRYTSEFVAVGVLSHVTIEKSTARKEYSRLTLLSQVHLCTVDMFQKICSLTAIDNGWDARLALSAHKHEWQKMQHTFDRILKVQQNRQ